MPPAAQILPAPLLPAAVSTVCLLAFTAIAGIDGLYFHLHRYRLYARPESRREHRLHTYNAVLFVPLVVLLFCLEPRGALLWLSVLLSLASLGIEILDVLCENESRRGLGGLTSIEYLMHFLMSGLRFGFVLPLLLAPPPALWALRETVLRVRPLALLLAGVYIAVPALCIAILHVVLLLRGEASGAARPVPASGA